MDPRQTAKGLVELAVDDSTTDEERSLAALRAVAFIHRHKLLSNPIDEVLEKSEIYRSFRTLHDKFNDPDVKSSLDAIRRGVSAVRKGVKDRKAPKKSTKRRYGGK